MATKDITSASSQPLCISVGGIREQRLAVLLFDRTYSAFIGIGDCAHEAEQFRALYSMLEGVDCGPQVQLDIKEISWRVWNIHSHEPYCILHPPAWSAAPLSFEETPIVSLANIPIVNPNGLTNEQVAEFRQDKESRKKLRRLRAFFHQNYKGQPLSFVEDDLLTRIDDHHSAVRKWGMETIDSTFSIAADERVLAGACAGLASVVAGVPLAQAVAIGATAVLGSTVVKIGMARLHLSIQQSQDPVSYIVDVLNKSKQ